MSKADKRLQDSQGERGYDNFKASYSKPYPGKAFLQRRLTLV